MSNRICGNDDRAYWLALHRAPGIGPRIFQHLLDCFGTARAVFDATVEDLGRCGITDPGLAYLRNPDWSAAELDLKWLNEPGHHLLLITDPGYPLLLREIADPPPVLFVHGDPALLSHPQLAIVGSRNPTPHGEQIAFDFSIHLSKSGLIITSGLALGIDGAAHRGALATNGATIAVAGTGLDKVYPARHLGLARNIIDHGAIVSEFPLGTPAISQNFPRRNRIISGLSIGTLVVEATSRSGSLITAHHALEQGREVFAIPGSIDNPLVRGCHALIRQGAKLVETVEDIMEELGPLLSRDLTVTTTGPRMAVPIEPLDDEYRRLWECVGFDPTSVDTLVEQTGLTAQSVSSMLLILEMRGYVNSLPGGLYIRCRTR